jgi:hypothetical protein
MLLWHSRSNCLGPRCLAAQCSHATSDLILSERELQGCAAKPAKKKEGVALPPEEEEEANDDDDFFNHCKNKKKESSFDHPRLFPYPALNNIRPPGSTYDEADRAKQCLYI